MVESVTAIIWILQHAHREQIRIILKCCHMTKPKSLHIIKQQKAKESNTNTSVIWASVETGKQKKHQTVRAPLYLRCSAHNTNPTALQLSCSISYVTIAKWVPIEGRDGTRGKWHSSPPLVERARQTVYFHLVRMLIGYTGRGQMGNAIHTGISAADTRPTESYADMSNKLPSKRKRETDRQGEGEVAQHCELSGQLSRRRQCTSGNGVWNSYRHKYLIVRLHRIYMSKVGAG